MKWVEVKIERTAEITLITVRSNKSVDTNADKADCSDKLKRFNAVANSEQKKMILRRKMKRWDFFFKNKNMSNLKANKHTNNESVN